MQKINVTNHSSLCTTLVQGVGNKVVGIGFRALEQYRANNPQPKTQTRTRNLKLLQPYPKAQNGPKALHNMVFRPKSLKI